MKAMIIFPVRSLIFVSNAKKHLYSELGERFCINSITDDSDLICRTMKLVHQVDAIWGVTETMQSESLVAIFSALE